MRRSRIAALTAGLAVLASGALSASAGAAFHLMKVSEVHEGVGDVGDFVELQMYEAGQNFVGGHYVRTYDGGGNEFSTFVLPSNVANGQSQRTVLIANDATVAGADFNAAGALKIVNANGGFCFLEGPLNTTAIDCVAWGAQMGTQPWGTPLALPGGTIPNNTSIVRTQASGCTTALDAADDTNNSSADFALGASTPRPNATAPTETLCATKQAEEEEVQEEEKEEGDGQVRFCRRQEEEVQEEKEEVERERMPKKLSALIVATAFGALVAPGAASADTVVMGSTLANPFEGGISSSSDGHRADSPRPGHEPQPGHLPRERRDHRLEGQEC